jgi:hypothetical protein
MAAAKTGMALAAAAGRRSQMARSMSWSITPVYLIYDIFSYRGYL